LVRACRQEKLHILYFFCHSVHIFICCYVVSCILKFVSVKKFPVNLLCLCICVKHGTKMVVQKNVALK
jgi:hypothetical protein